MPATSTSRRRAQYLGMHVYLQTGMHVYATIASCHLFTTSPFEFSVRLRGARD